MKKRKKSLNLDYKIYSEETINKYQKRIDLLGYNNSYDAVIFLNIRLLTTIFLFFMLLYIFELGFIIAPAISIIYFYFLPKVVIDKNIAARADILDGDAMYFFEVL